MRTINHRILEKYLGYLDFSLILYSFNEYYGLIWKLSVSNGDCNFRNHDGNFGRDNEYRFVGPLNVLA